MCGLSRLFGVRDADRIADRVATIEASGTKVITLSTETRAQIRESAAPVYESIRGAINEEIYEAYMN